MATKVKNAETEKFHGVDINPRFRASNSFNLADAIAAFNDGKAEDSQNIATIRNRRMNQELALIYRGIVQIAEFSNSTTLASVISQAKLSSLGKNVIAVILPNAGYSASKGKILWEEIEPAEGQVMHRLACVNINAFKCLTSVIRAGHDSDGNATASDPKKNEQFKELFMPQKSDEEKAEKARERFAKAIKDGLIDRETLQAFLADMPKAKA